MTSRNPDALEKFRAWQAPVESKPLAPRRLLQQGEVVGRLHTSDGLNIPHACGNALPHYPTPDCISSPTSVASELSFSDDGMEANPEVIDEYMMFETQRKVVALWQEKKKNSRNDNNN